MSKPPKKTLKEAKLLSLKDVDELDETTYEADYDLDTDTEEAPGPDFYSVRKTKATSLVLNAPNHPGLFSLTLIPEKTDPVTNEKTKARTVILKIAGQFKVEAATQDLDYTNKAVRISWLDDKQKPHSTFITKAELHGDGLAVVQRLASEGFVIERDKKLRDLFLEFMLKVEPRESAWTVNNTGWTKDGVFVLPHKVFVPSSRAIETYYLNYPSENHFATKGTLEEWQQNVAHHCDGNSRPMFAICTALSGPLYQRLGEQASGWSFFQGSTNGKTVAVKCGASVYGNSMEMMQTWNNTALKLENLALTHTGTFLFLDEMSKLDPDMGNSIIYNLSSGKTRGGMLRDNKGSRPDYQWNTIFFATSERTLEDILRGGHKAQNAGEEVRFVEIPMNIKDLNRGWLHGSVFEFSDSANPIKDVLLHLDKTTTEFYGSAGDAFLERLTNLTKEDWEACREWKNTWADRHTPKGADHQVGRIINKFAMTALAGYLAQGWGILPWTYEAQRLAMDECLRAWFEFRGNINKGETNKALENLVSFIDSKISRFSCLSMPYEVSTKIPNQAGWISNGVNPEYYYFNASAWKEMANFPNKLNSKNLSLDLRAKGILQWNTTDNKDYKDKRMGSDGTKLVRIVDKIALDWFMKYNKPITAEERMAEVINYGGENDE